MVKKSEVTRNQPSGLGGSFVSSSETGDQSWPLFMHHKTHLLDLLKGTEHLGGISLQKTTMLATFSHQFGQAVGFTGQLMATGTPHRKQYTVLPHVTWRHWKGFPVYRIHLLKTVGGGVVTSLKFLSDFTPWKWCLEDLSLSFGDSVTFQVASCF